MCILWLYVFVRRVSAWCWGDIPREVVCWHVVARRSDVSIGHVTGEGAKCKTCWVLTGMTVFVVERDHLVE